MNATALLPVFSLSFVIAMAGCHAMEVAQPERQAAKAPANEAEDPAELYYQAYLVNRDAELTEEPAIKRQKMQQALASFEAIKAQFPEWKTQMVETRIQFTKQRLAALTKANQ